jgi:glycosyltransferase involved in cell wall biosynthesis
MTAVDREMIERVKAEKRRRRASPNDYQDRPKLAFIVHSFNRISNIEQLVGGLRGLGEHELIVCEDGSLDGSHEKWMSYLDRPNDFLIHSNDLHEIRILDRAIRFARSDIVCLVQDDDLIPRDTDWLEAALGHLPIILAWRFSAVSKDTKATTQIPPRQGPSGVVANFASSTM